MTALTTRSVPVHLEEDANLLLLPWRRMAWVTWRQHRYALGGVAVFLGALAVLLWLAGLQLHHTYTAAIACRPVGSASCAALINKFDGMDDFLTNGAILQVVPPLIGAFVGATILARELETGTFRYAWTQGFGRWRWTLAKLVMLAVVVAAAAGAFSVLTTWYYEPYFAAGNQILAHPTVAPPPPTNPFAATLFDLRGVVFAAWTLVAFAIAGLAGLLIRRVVPAIVATLVVYAGLAFAAVAFLRQHYLAPLVTNKLNVPTSAHIVSQWGTRYGKVAWTGSLPPSNLVLPNCPPAAPPGVHVPKPSVDSILRCLPQHGSGYALWTSYQPASRFWPFQFIEGGWLFALSALLMGATVWLVRRRAA